MRYYPIVGTSHERSKHWLKIGDHERSKYRKSRFMNLDGWLCVSFYVCVASNLVIGSQRLAQSRQEGGLLARVRASLGCIPLLGFTE